MQTVSVITVQSNFRRLIGGEVPTAKNIRDWLNSLNETGNYSV